ncbi:MAG TPA: hypothetical protein VMT85_04360 [Thermoanaerobaculia bacterium]|nr:hypothetical protein [Thermoanaerobaculia bacterium]
MLLSEPLLEGEETELCFEYALQVYGHVYQRTWYPTPRNRGADDRYPTRIALEHSRWVSTLATGRQVVERDLGAGVRETVWESERPVDGALFAYALTAGQAGYSFDGVPRWWRSARCGATSRWASWSCSPRGRSTR